MEIVLSGNSPGELWGWIRPLVFAMRNRLPQASLSLFLFPCPYATGKEKKVAQELLGIETVVSPKESMQYIFLGKKPPRFSFHDSVLIHLGGDLMFASLLARRLGAKAYAYQWGEKIWDRAISGYFVTHERQKEILVGRRIPEKKIAVVGDLVMDAMQLEFSASNGGSRINKENFLVTLLPGSRIPELKHILPFYLRIVEKAKERLPGVTFYLVLSPFVDDWEVAQVIDSKHKHILESSSGILVEDEKGKRIRTSRGAEVFVSRGNHYRLMSTSDCILTVPGTKCGEAGFLGTPMLVILPTNKLEEIPYPGIPNLIEKIPLAGRRLKRLLLQAALPKFGFMAQPNILAEEEVVPELVGKLTPDFVAGSLAALLQDQNKRERISAKLKQVYARLEPAAEKMISLIAKEALRAR